MKYQFDPNDAYEFARKIGAEAHRAGDELRFRACPYCGGKSKDKYTFAISLNTGAFNCKRSTCDAHGNMITLARDFGFDLHDKLTNEYYTHRKTYKTFSVPADPPKPSEDGIAYLNGRGISNATIEKYKIRTVKDHPKTLGFVFYSPDGKEINFVKYRKTDFDKERDNAKEWSEGGGKPVLFGMDTCKSRDRLIITEGQIDALSVSEAGYDNVVSVPNGCNGSTWIPYCWDWVSEFEEIIIFGDHENDHITLVDMIRNRWNKLIKVVSVEDYIDCKDANDILRKYGVEQIRKCVEGAKAETSKRLKYHRDIKRKKPQDVERLKLNIAAVNGFLGGGLPFGSLVVITGKAGEGKSTFASQILAYALTQSYTVFAYSGELPDHRFADWLDLQIAGESTHSYQAEGWNEPAYYVDDDDKVQIDKWIDDKLLLYDNTPDFSEEETFDGIIKVMEQAILVNGARVLLVDNLMTALDEEPMATQDKYDAQSKFAKKLTSLAVRTNTLILLVAHKRKNNVSNGNDEISGSADIGNLASITFSYERDRKDPSKRLLKITKNRETGDLNEDGWEMSFDKSCKRIYLEEAERKEFWGWYERKSNSPYVFVPVQGDLDDCPF